MGNTSSFDSKKGESSSLLSSVSVNSKHNSETRCLPSGSFYACSGYFPSLDDSSSINSASHEPSSPVSRNTDNDSRDAHLHYLSGGVQDFHSLDDAKKRKSPVDDRHLLSVSLSSNEGEEKEGIFGLEETDSGIHSKSSLGTPKHTLSFGSSNKPKSIRTGKGKDLYNGIKAYYKLKERYDHPSKEFLREMDKLFMEVQLYLTELSARSATSSHKEADSLVEELIALRNHWGLTLLPLNVCNTFVRERIQLTVNGVRYRIDCAQFFEPVPFFSSPSAPSSGELMKLFRFSIYEMSRNEVIMRYYLERSNVVQFYHVLCSSWGNQRGQVYGFGSECPSYWALHDKMIQDAGERLKLT